MLKRTLVAAALLASFGASSATVYTGVTKTFEAADADKNAVVYAIEGSEDASKYAAPQYIVKLSAEYQIGDTVKFAFNAKLATGSAAAATLVSHETATVVSDVTTLTTSSAPITLGLLSSDDTSVTYRITSRTGSTSATYLILNGLELDDASVETVDKVSVTYSAQTSTGVVIDNATTNTLAGTILLKDELSTKVKTKADAVVDVAEERAELISTTDVIAVTTAQALYSNPATITGQEVVINGDFSWLIDTVPATTTSITPVSGVIAVTGPTSAVFSTTVKADSITLKTTSGHTNVGDFTVTIDPTANFVSPATAASAVLPAKAYTADATITYTAGTKTGLKDTSLASTSIGSWTLNGKTAKVQAYPLGTNIENFLWVTNDGSLEGAISATAIANGEEYELGNVGTAGAQSLTYIATAVNEALAAEGLTSGRVQLNITVNSPESNVNVYAGYKVTSDADRLTLTVE